jgi:hypothetical protein
MTMETSQAQDDYIDALLKVQRIETRLKELWDKGDYKRRNKVIWSEWSKAKQRANKAQRRLLRALQSLSQDLS